MSSPPTQNRRLFELTTPLGADVLLATRFDAHEGLSELFEIRIQAISLRENIDFDALIGRKCNIEFRSFDNKKRHFNGVACEAQWEGRNAEFHVYRLVLRPWLWQLSHTTNCRIFKKKSTPDIIKEVFDKEGFTDYQFVLNENYPPRDYCVQYRETHLAFVTRLMEEEGIYFYFEHNESEHKLIMVDAKATHKPVQNLPTVELIPDSDRHSRDKEHLTDWASDRQFRSGKVALNDYDFTRPNARILQERTGTSTYQKGQLEVYDYPGAFFKEDRGERYAKVRLEAIQCQDRRRQGSGRAPSLYPGALVTLAKHTTAAENRGYLITRAHHSAESTNFRTGEGSATQYSGNYEFLQRETQFRALPLTPRPVVHGPQTAKVVGESGEEIDVDRHGRIKVQFHWDRDKTQSRRVRVAQIWSGKAWGGIVIPRIGQEVVVEFLEGDPDRPLVIGTVYNGENVVPYDLPANKTIAGVKSNSSKGGGGYNELVFEDKKSSELIRMHAEKDLSVVVEDQETREVGPRFSRGGGNARTTTIRKGNDLLKVADENLTIDVAKKILIKAGVEIELRVGSSKIVIDGSRIKVKANHVKVEGSATYKTTAPQTEFKADATMTIKGGMVYINCS